ncbi:flagellin [Actimicrobium sp. CCC2.4]|uniref:flagellin N-terminal helical domain-containing protein n=1 Tax=Actimicrobium sp. CCC2.4 TaxID=3048606 RepID=UPI002AC8DC8A|nr:flagellin [Actimicrobium sp. CCC2.4]MEB0136408.1 flagellin [Actimicrobium sp. CCC2.4]WPX31227.1 flagellin [Actimicrobium sp. CCC2.4]
MASFINTNLASLNAQRNLTTSQSGLATSLQRLSSGLRINSAKDDAAGLAISERLTSQINGSDQAGRNANDGISLAQTAEGDLAQIGNNLQRIRELAVQSANGSNSASDRASINNESKSLIAEIDRVASNSSFNGNKLLDGSFTSQSFQIGANGTANDRISIASISSAKASSLGVGSSSSYSTTPTASGAVSNSAALTQGELALNGFSVGASATDGVSFTSGTSSGIAIAAAINAISGASGVTASVGATTTTGTTVTAAGFATAIADNDITLNGVNLGPIAAAGSIAERGGQVAAAVNSKSSQTGVTATFDTATGAVALKATDGRNVTLTTTANAAAVATGLGSGGATTVTTGSTVSLSSSSSAGITVSALSATAAAKAGQTIGFTAATATAGAGISSLNLDTAAGAQSALATIDSALASISSSRASLGAVQNRFASVVSSLQTTSENLSASRSRIQDTDFASETAKLTRGQILQQAGTAMLAQANSLPNGVLSLLR